MRIEVARIIEHDSHDELPALVAALQDESALWELMSNYNWDDGFAVPLAVVSHPRCDRALALRIFWELDDSAQLFLSDEEVEEDQVAYCTVLVGRLRDESYPIGGNTFDTGYFDLDNPSLTDRQRKLRAGNTKFAQGMYDDVFLRPVL